MLLLSKKTLVMQGKAVPNTHMHAHTLPHKHFGPQSTMPHQLMWKDITFGKTRAVHSPGGCACEHGHPAEWNPQSTVMG